MANKSKKSIKGFGLKDILNFLRGHKKREAEIAKSDASPIPQDFPINHAAKLRHPNEQVFEIIAIFDHHNETKTYRLLRKDRRNPALFRAGQYVVIRQMIEGKLIARPISISSGIDEAMHGFMDITIKEDPSGYFSPWVIAHYKVGDEVITSAPQGQFYYTHLRDEKHVIAVAGGSGITPFLSMAKSILSGDEDFNLDVIYCLKRYDDAIGLDEWEIITKACPKIKLHLLLEEVDERASYTGLISKEIIEEIAGNKPYSLFACGRQGMYVYLDGIAKELGLDSKHYRKEIFGIHKDPNQLPGYELIQKDRPLSAKVIIAGTSHTIPLNPNETILTALERAGIAGPNRCRGGICGFCRSKLLQGQVYVPTDTDGRRAHDKETGYIHPCACFPLTDIVIEMPSPR